MDRSLSEESVGIIIINKLASSNVVVSFAEIARVARANKRLHLAAQVYMLKICWNFIPCSRNPLGSMIKGSVFISGGGVLLN